MMSCILVQSSVCALETANNKEKTFLSRTRQIVLRHEMTMWTGQVKVVMPCSDWPVPLAASRSRYINEWRIGQEGHTTFSCVSRNRETIMRLFASIILALACTVFAEDIPEVDDSINIHAGTGRELLLSYRIRLESFFRFDFYIVWSLSQVELQTLKACLSCLFEAAWILLLGSSIFCCQNCRNIENYGKPTSNT